MDEDFVPRGDNESDYAWETRYASYRWDAESALYHVRYRILQPLLGCWITTDPVTYLGGSSLYEYCASNGPTYSDASGLLLNVQVLAGIVFDKTSVVQAIYADIVEYIHKM